LGVAFVLVYFVFDQKKKLVHKKKACVYCSAARLLVGSAVQKKSWLWFGFLFFLFGEKKVGHQKKKFVCVMRLSVSVGGVALVRKKKKREERKRKLEGRFQIDRKKTKGT